MVRPFAKEAPGRISGLIFLDDVEATDIQFLKTAVSRSELLNFFEANIRANAERL